MSRNSPRPRGSASPIAAARIAAGLTQAQLAEKVGCHKRYISHWETGMYMPRIDALVKIAKAIGCSVESLLPPDGGDGP